MIDSHLPTYIRIRRQPGQNSSLVIMVEPHTYDGFSLKEEDLNEIIRSHEAENWYRDREQIEALLFNQNSLQTATGYIIAEPRDCKIGVTFSPDRLKAWITVRRALGGIPLTEKLLSTELANAKVLYGIIADEVNSILQNGHAENILIAEGTPSQPGVDSDTEELIKESEDKGRPHQRKDGSVDFFELGLFVSVHQGAELMRKYPASPGTPGMRIDGEAIPSTPGKDRSINLGAGTALSEYDPNLVIATVSGQPVFGKNTVKVVQKLELQDVNFKTGNVDFDGTVLIRGSINPGFKVRAGADLVVSDTVEGAELVAQGNIELRGGFFGKKQGRIEAHGNIRVRFMDGCKVHCGGDLEVEDLISNCTINCEGSVHLGKKGGRGQVYGGKISAVKGIFGKILGSPSEVETHVEMSPSPTMLAREIELESEISKNEKNLDSLERSLSYLRRAIHRDEARISSFVEACRLTNEKLQSMKTEFAEIMEKISTYSEGHIRFGQAFPGTTLVFGKKKKIITTFLKDVFLGPEQTPSPHDAATKS